MVDDWRQSGLSQAAYARQHQIPPHRLSYWTRELAATSPTPPAATIQRQAAPEPFIQIPWQAAPRGRGSIEVHLESGALIRAFPGADPDLLRAVIQILSKTAC